MKGEIDRPGSLTVSSRFSLAHGTGRETKSSWRRTGSSTKKVLMSMTSGHSRESDDPTSMVGRTLHAVDALKTISRKRVKSIMHREEKRLPNRHLCKGN
eukprot:scaffold585_cov330-Pavlova_lutheri.AAC.32